MIYQIEYKEFFRETIGSKNNSFIPVDFKLVLYSADNLKEAEQLFWEDHTHDDIEIRRTVSLEEVKKGRVFGPIKER